MANNVREKFVMDGFGHDDQFSVEVRVRSGEKEISAEATVIPGAATPNAGTMTNVHLLVADLLVGIHAGTEAGNEKSNSDFFERQKKLWMDLLKVRPEDPSRPNESVSGDRRPNDLDLVEALRRTVDRVREMNNKQRAGVSKSEAEGKPTVCDYDKWSAVPEAFQNDEAISWKVVNPTRPDDVIRFRPMFGMTPEACRQLAMHAASHLNAAANITPETAHKGG